MASKSLILSFLIASLAVHSVFSNPCDNFYTKVTYGLSHSKKALSATNFEHQMYYAERALTSLEKSKSYMSECGCEKSEDKTLDAIESLNKAISPADWDAGRYFTKKSIGIINELITILDECTMGNTVEDNAENELENDADIDLENTNTDTLELEIIQSFEKNSEDKLETVESAIEQLILFSKSFAAIPAGNEGNPNAIASRQKAYIEEARQMLRDGLKRLGEEETANR